MEKHEKEMLTTQSLKTRKISTPFFPTQKLKKEIKIKKSVVTILF
jgi:hypothetical protein